MSKPSVPKSLTEDQIKFWLSNTSLSREDLLKWYNSFQDFSTKNKKLDRDNFFKFFEQLNHAKKDSETFYKLAFHDLNLNPPKKAFDKDNSGSIDFHEFLVAFNVLSHGDVNARLEWIFEVYDQNGDKSIDRKEMVQLVKAICKMNQKQLVGDQTMETKIEEIFDKLDDNENDKITKEEFIKNCAQNVFLRETLMPKV